MNQEFSRDMHALVEGSRLASWYQKAWLIDIDTKNFSV